MSVKPCCSHRFRNFCTILSVIFLCGACVRIGPYIDPEEPDPMSPGAGIFSGEAGYFALGGPTELKQKDTIQVYNPTDGIVAINLTCRISFDDFDGIERAVITRDIILTHTKHGAGGMRQVSQSKDYEFWVMIHDVEPVMGQEFIKNFQVAIKHKASKLFMHALSATSHSPEFPAEKSRVSLVEYYPGTTRKKGELIFACLRNK